MKKVITYGIVGVVILVVVYLFATGRFNKDAAEELGREAYYKGKGAAGKALNPTSVAPGDYRGAEQCRANLREIERGKRLVAQSKGAAVGAVSVQEVEAAVGKKLPTCPSGGKYTLRTLEYLPVCSIGNNSNLDPKDDHVILMY